MSRACKPLTICRHYFNAFVFVTNVIKRWVLLPSSEYSHRIDATGSRGQQTCDWSIPVHYSEDPLFELVLLLGLEVRVRIAYVRNSGPESINPWLTNNHVRYCYRTSDVFVGELDVNDVVARFSRSVLHLTRSVSVVFTLNVRLTGSLHWQTQTAQSCSQHIHCESKN